MFKEEQKHSSIFYDFTPEQIDLVMPLLEYCQFIPEETIFEQGEAAIYLYFLVAGMVNIRYKPYDGPAVIIARIESDGVFGWSSALGRRTYTSAAISATEVIAYRIETSKLASLCELFPKTGVILLDKLAVVISQGYSKTQSQVYDMLSKGVFLNSRKG